MEYMEKSNLDAFVEDHYGAVRRKNTKRVRMSIR
jgi:hypothetical protein